jgi:hypothetical protein
MPHRPAAGQVLVVELSRADGTLFLTRLLRVAYAAPTVGGGYRIGGQFLRALAPGEFEVKVFSKTIRASR